MTQQHCVVHTVSREATLPVPPLFLRWDEETNWWISSHLCFRGVSGDVPSVASASMESPSLHLRSFSAALAMFQLRTWLLLLGVAASPSFFHPLVTGASWCCWFLSHHHPLLGFVTLALLILFHQFSILNCFPLKDLEFFFSNYIPFNMIMCPIKWGPKKSLSFSMGQCSEKPISPISVNVILQRATGDTQCHSPHNYPLSWSRTFQNFHQNQRSKIYQQGNVWLGFELGHMPLTLTLLRFHGLFSSWFPKLSRSLCSASFQVCSVFFWL